MDNNRFYGSICLSDIPEDVKRHATNGKVYVNVSIAPRKEVGKFGHTHYISCRPKEAKEGVNYFIGDLKPSAFEEQPTQVPQEVAQPQPQPQEKIFNPYQDNLPF